MCCLRDPTVTLSSVGFRENCPERNYLPSYLMQSAQ